MGTALADRLAPDGALAAEETEGDYRPRVAAAAIACVSRYGLAKTTVDDIARQAGLSRATIYRAFPGGRDEVLVTAVCQEVEAFFAELAGALSSCRELEELLVTALTKAAEALAGHRALGFLLAHEPEVILPFLSFDRSDLVLERAGDFLAPFLSPHLPESEARRVGQWVARLVLSYVACPHPELGPLGSRRQRGETAFSLHPEPIGPALARRLVANFLLPGVQVLKESSKETSR